TDIYEFDIGGPANSTVGASAVSLLNSPAAAAATFDLTLELLQWNPITSTYDPISGTSGTGTAVVTSTDLSPGSGGGNSSNSRYELTITGHPSGATLATYGGSIAVVAVPEPSMTLLLIGGLVSVGFLSRR